MVLNKPAHRVGTLLAMILLMVATRSHHIASALHLADASVAIFFLAGLLMRHRLGYFVALLGAAAAIDYWAITYNGVSSFCISEAYVMLVPTYATLWMGGLWVASRGHEGKAMIGALVPALLCSSLIAHVISSGSFYLWSGRFAAPSFSTFIAREITYAPAYVGYAFFYVALGCTVYFILGHRPTQGSLSNGEQ